MKQLKLDEETMALAKAGPAIAKAIADAIAAHKTATVADNGSIPSLTICNERCTCTFFLSLRDAESYANNLGIPRTSVTVNYLSAKYDHLSERFVTICNKFRKEGLFRVAQPNP